LHDRLLRLTEVLDDGTGLAVSGHALVGPDRDVGIRHEVVSSGAHGEALLARNLDRSNVDLRNLHCIFPLVLAGWPGYPVSTACRSDEHAAGFVDDVAEQRLPRMADVPSHPALGCLDVPGLHRSQ